MTKIKICGLTRPEDVERCLALGVDFLGFNLWRGSKRRLAPHQARALVKAVGSRAITVGVFVHGEPEDLVCAEYAGVGWVQIHGTPAGWAKGRISRPAIRALPVNGPLSPQDLEGADYFLLDTPQAGQGGGGRSFDWSLAEKLVGDSRLFIAGGLTQENVGEVVRRLKPWAVEVASGCESAPGIKDPAKLKAFVKAVREAR